MAIGTGAAGYRAPRQELSPAVWWTEPITFRARRRLTTLVAMYGGYRHQASWLFVPCLNLRIAFTSPAGGGNGLIHILLNVVSAFSDTTINCSINCTNDQITVEIDGTPAPSSKAAPAFDIVFVSAIFRRMRRNSSGASSPVNSSTPAKALIRMVPWLRLRISPGYAFNANGHPP